MRRQGAIIRCLLLQRAARSFSGSGFELAVVLCVNTQHQYQTRGKKKSIPWPSGHFVSKKLENGQMFWSRQRSLGPSRKFGLVGAEEEKNCLLADSND